MGLAFPEDSCDVCWDPARLVIYFIGEPISQWRFFFGVLALSECRKEFTVSCIRLHGRQPQPPRPTSQMFLLHEDLLGKSSAYKADACARIIGQLNKEFDQWPCLMLSLRRSHCILDLVYKDQSDMVCHTEDFYLGSRSADGKLASLPQLVKITRPDHPIQCRKNTARERFHRAV